jgi:putative transcriptional regulator
LGMDIRKAREALGLTQQQLAVKLGVVVATVYRWEARKAKPSPLATEKLRTLAKASGRNNQP